MKELNLIQTTLVSNKGLHNDFGDFDYRSLESILNDVKPLLKQHECTITFTDDLVLIGDRYYVKSTATLRNAKGETESSVAFAREQASKKGMDEAQITGSASSYARKYAACSMLGISNGFDPDFMDNREEGKQSSKKPQKPAEKPANNQPAQPTVQDAIAAVKAAKNRAELDGLWARFAAYQSNPNFVQACNSQLAVI